jgi:hypothetical protein
MACQEAEVREPRTGHAALTSQWEVNQVETKHTARACAERRLVERSRLERRHEG